MGETTDEEMDYDEGKVLLEEMEREWLETLGGGDGDDEITDDACDSKGDEDAEGPTDDLNDVELIDEGENELLDLLEDSRIEPTLDDYV